MVSTIGRWTLSGFTMPKRRRRYWTVDEKRRIVAQARAPGTSVSRVARLCDVNANLVFKWLRDPRFRPRREDAEATSFLPVEIVAEPEPVVAARAEPNSEIEILLVNGHRLRLSGSFDPDAVSRLVRGMSR